MSSPKPRPLLRKKLRAKNDAVALLKTDLEERDDDDDDDDDDDE